MELDLDLEIERQETLFLLMKTFVESSVLVNNQISTSIAAIHKILNLCVRSNQFIRGLELSYLTIDASRRLCKEIEVVLWVDWETHGLELSSGATKFKVTESDILGSISPLYRRLAAEIRGRCLKVNVQQLSYGIWFTDEVEADKTLRANLCQQLNLTETPSEESKRLSSDFRNAPRQQIVVQVDRLREVEVQATWRKR